MTANKNVSFGFGTMRLPLLDPGDPTSFDFDRIQALFDRFLELGFRYFDTAYTYHGYEGEKAVRKSTLKRFRCSVTVGSKGSGLPRKEKVEWFKGFIPLKASVVWS